MGIRDWIERRGREKGQTGLNEMGNNARMTLIITGPFFAGWVTIQMLVPEEFVQMALAVTFGFWIGYCMMVYTYAKNDAMNYRPFPQSTWRFPDGGVRVFNILVPRDGFEKVCDFKDGSKGYHVEFAGKYEYQMAELPYPHVFGGAWFKVPDLYDKAFTFRSGGEFFHKGIAIEHPACENISVYVLGWSVKEGVLEPVCLINDCSYQYSEVLENSEKTLPSELLKAQRFEMLWRAGRKREMNLLARTTYLEDTQKVYMEESPPDIDKQIKTGMEAVRKKVRTIMATEEPLIQRIFTWKNLFKAVILVGVILVLTHFLFGWP